MVLVNICLWKFGVRMGLMLIITLNMSKVILGPMGPWNVFLLHYNNVGYSDGPLVTCYFFWQFWVVSWLLKAVLGWLELFDLSSVFSPNHYWWSTGGGGRGGYSRGGLQHYQRDLMISPHDSIQLYSWTKKYFANIFSSGFKRNIQDLTSPLFQT